MHDAIETRLERIERRGIGNVRIDEREAAIIEKFLNILDSSHRQVVDADDVPSVLEKPFQQIRAQEAGDAGHQDALSVRMCLLAHACISPARSSARSYAKHATPGCVQFTPDANRQTCTGRPSDSLAEGARLGRGDGDGASL